MGLLLCIGYLLNVWQATLARVYDVIMECRRFVLW